MKKKLFCSLLMLMLAVMSVNAQPSLTKLIQAVDNSGSAQNIRSQLIKSKYTKLKYSYDWLEVWAKGCSAKYTYYKTHEEYKFSKPKNASANAISLYITGDGQILYGISMTVFGSTNVKAKIQEIKALGFKKMPINPTDYYDPADSDIVDAWVYMRKDNPYVPLIIYEHKGGVYEINYIMS